MPNNIQKRIIMLRKNAGKTQSQAADELNMSRTTYAYNEKRATRLSTEFIEAVAKLYHVPTTAILYGANESIVPDLKEPTRNDYYSATTDTLITTDKETKLIKMLRMLPNDYMLSVFKQVKTEYENQNSK